MVFALAACAGQQPEPAAPPWLLGRWMDDYGMEYEITAEEWGHLPQSRYHISQWNADSQFLIAWNDTTNPGEGGKWTRIDWMELEGMPPYTWGYCYTVYDAPSAAAAESVSTADRTTPMTGCNGFPFSRMRRAPAGSGGESLGSD